MRRSVATLGSAGHRRMLFGAFVAATSIACEADIATTSHPARPNVATPAVTQPLAQKRDFPVSLAASPTPPNIRYQGRFEQDESRVRFAWSGSSIHASFVGTGVAAIFETVTRAEPSGGDHLSVQIDDRPPSILALRPGKHLYMLADSLPAERHRLAITKRTEAAVGTIAFHGLQLQGTEAREQPNSPPRPSERRIEFIGDSITAGYGNEGLDETCPFDARTENHLNAFGPLAAKQLGADFVSIAWSGKGLHQNRDREDPVTMQHLYSRILPRQASSQWVFSQWQPHAVVVNLGTNDFGASPADPAGFEAAYQRFLSDLRLVYPKALLVAAVGPMLYDRPWRPSLTEARTAIQRAIHQRRLSGDEKLAFIEFQQQQQRDGFGCDWHPSQRTHARMADRLAALLRDELGW